MRIVIRGRFNRPLITKTCCNQMTLLLIVSYKAIIAVLLYCYRSFFRTTFIFMGRHRIYEDINARKAAYRVRNRERINEAQRNKYREIMAAMTLEGKEKQREKSSKFVKAFRQRQKDNMITNHSSSEYKTSQSLGKAVKKVSHALPNCPQKVAQVLAKVVNKRAPQLLESKAVDRDLLHLRRQFNELSPGTLNEVNEFFKSENVVWVSPLARDFIRLPGTRGRISRCYLTCTLNEAYRVFQERNPETKIGFSTFCQLRPSNVRLMRDIPEMVCLCRYHENFRMLVEAIGSRVLGVPKKSRAFLELVVCDIHSPTCMLTEECENCSVKWLEFMNSVPEEGKQSVIPVYHQWATVNKQLQRVAVLGETLDCVLQATHL